ncbi:emp24/gp25L/p24 family/GOLD-domain-containing protein [Lactarius deliciosus]|nr:emp24/gp25L/p24 family/GOLD-domain-containing protein [Lactarius deliciosus]
MLSSQPTLLFLTLISVLILSHPTRAIKFSLPASRYPPPKCIWNAAHTNALVNHIEIIDSSPQKNAITSHSEGEVGVCFKNYLDHDVPAHEAKTKARIVDLDVDIGADAVDYKPEMRKLEGIVKEIVDEMDYLKKREERFQGTNVSTNLRVQNFAWFTILALLALGAWQIMHLRFVLQA